MSSVTSHNGFHTKFNTISLIEGGTHYEVLSCYLFMLHEHIQYLHVYTNTYVWHLLDEQTKSLKNVTFHVANKGEGFNSFLFNNLKEINSSDIVLCTTIDTYKEGKYLKSEFTPPTFLLVHCLNELNQPYSFNHWRYAPDGYFMLFARLLKSLWTRSYFDRKKNFNTFKFILVPSDVMLEEAKKLPAYSNKSIGVAPFFAIPHYESNPKKLRSDTLNVVIPGTINNRTRDYKMATKIITLTAKSRPITLTLLGVLKDQNLIKDLLQLTKTQPDFELKTYSHEVDAKTYKHELEQADIALLPFRSKVRHGIVLEYTGRTFLSGNINDVCRARIPIVYPIEVPLPSELNDLGYSYIDVESAVKILETFDQAQADQELSKFNKLSEQLNYNQQGKKMMATMLSQIDKA